MIGILLKEEINKTSGDLEANPIVHSSLIGRSEGEKCTSYKNKSMDQTNIAQECFKYPCISFLVRHKVSSTYFSLLTPSYTSFLSLIFLKKSDLYYQHHFLQAGLDLLESRPLLSHKGSLKAIQPWKGAGRLAPYAAPLPYSGRVNQIWTPQCSRFNEREVPYTLCNK